VETIIMTVLTSLISELPLIAITVLTSLISALFLIALVSFWTLVTLSVVRRFAYRLADKRTMLTPQPLGRRVARFHSHKMIDIS
jgi:hypothetical protein